MLSLCFLCLWGVTKSPRDRLFGDLRGSWSGQIAYSPSDGFSSVEFGPYSLDFSLSKDKTTLTGTLTNSSTTFSFFAQHNFGSADGINLLSSVADDIGELAIQNPDNGHAFLLRGLVRPKNDQITVAIERTYLTVAITDQFSSNVTVMTFGQAGRNQQITKYVKIGLLLATIGAILYGLYRTGDLADVIKPAEAQDTKLIRAMSKAEDIKQQKKKKGEGEPAKEKTQ
jgi:hypothetical protein